MAKSLPTLKDNRGNIIDLNNYRSIVEDVEKNHLLLKVMEILIKGARIDTKSYGSTVNIGGGHDEIGCENGYLTYHGGYWCGYYSGSLGLSDSEENQIIGRFICENGKFKSSEAGKLTFILPNGEVLFTVEQLVDSCYIATCVYGSYECPEVWTLRRFRDDILKRSFGGRLFIRTYYAVSPKIVNLFGKKKWFHNLWKPVLNRMVNKLHSKGVDNGSYIDY